MCGKFTAMASWRQVHDFSQPLTIAPGEAPAEAAGEVPKGSNDAVVTYRPMSNLPVIVFDRQTGCRRIVPMRWGFPHRKDPRIPQPIHARSESIQTTAAFCDAFAEGQRGIVVMRTFNEGREIASGKTEQWTIDPGDGCPRGFAFVWRRFDLEGLPMPLLACVMVTVPANALITRTIMADIDDPRMPAILEDADWSAWLGETAATPEAARATLKTMEGLHWQMQQEPKKPKPEKPPRPAPPPSSDPQSELF